LQANLHIADEQYLTIDDNSTSATINGNYFSPKNINKLMEIKVKFNEKEIFGDIPNFSQDYLHNCRS